MSPNFRHGDFVIGLSWPWTNYRKGDVVVIKHPIYNNIIKRILQVDNLGNIQIAGDNPESTSSIALGVHHSKNIVSKVIYRIPSL